MTSITTSRRARRALPALLASSVLTLGLAGCATTTGDTDGAGDAAAAAPALTVVATTTHTAEFTERVAGDLADVTALIQPNQSTHSFDPTAADLQALAAADVLVINGAGLEEWLDDAVSSSGFAGETVDASSQVGLIEFAAEDAHGHEGGDAHSEDAHAHEGEDAHAHEGDDHAHEGDDHAHEGDDHAHEEDVAAASTEEESHSEGDDHDHAHDGGDPHIWTSASNAAAMVQAIADGLSAADAENADSYEANAAAYIAELEQLDAWITESIGAVDPAARTLVTNHEAFGYFVDAYDVTYVGAIIPSFDDNAEVSAADIDGLVERVRDTGATAVFSETTLSPAAAETIASEAGVEVFSGEDGLYGDSLGPAGSPGETYIGSMIHNVTVLVTAWGGELAAVPDALAE